MPRPAPVYRRLFALIYDSLLVLAILMLPVLTLYVYIQFFQSDSFDYLSDSARYEVVAPPNSRTQFELADGTMVWLNQGSKLVYPNRFVGSYNFV